MLPVVPPNQIGLDVLRPSALPNNAAARVQEARGLGATAEFTVGVPPEPAAADKAAASASPEGFRRFEAMVLQTFIQNMLPKDGAAVYGKGMAGDMWKSLLAENLAEVMAERGGIGIADRLLGEHYAAKTASAVRPAEIGEAPASEITDAAESRFRIAPAVLDGMQRSLSRLLDDELVSSPQAATRFAINEDKV